LGQLELIISDFTLILILAIASESLKLSAHIIKVAFELVYYKNILPLVILIVMYHLAAAKYPNTCRSMTRSSAPPNPVALTDLFPNFAGCFFSGTFSLVFQNKFHSIPL